MSLDFNQKGILHVRMRLLGQCFLKGYHGFMVCFVAKELLP